MSVSINVKYDNYIPNEEDAQKSNLATGSALTVVLFLLSGCPNSWNIQDTLWLELSWFEASQPEGYTLASWLILMQAVSALIFYSLLYIETHVITFPKIGILYCASLATVLISIVLSFAWNFSVDGMSLILYLGSSVGQMVGWVQNIFFIPWLAKNFNPRLISAFASGNAFLVLILVFLQIIQQPGGSQTFSPSIYYVVAAIIYATTFGVCVYTFNSGRGRLTPTDAVQALEPWRNSLWTQTFPAVFWETKLFTFGRIWANQWSWTVTPIALPYAADNTTTSAANDGENFLQWAIAVGYLMLLAGSLSSYIPTGKYYIGEALGFNSLANGVILLAAGNIGEWSSWPMKFVLMTAVAVSRFSVGWVIPLCLREIQRRFPEKSELLVRSNAIWSLYANVTFRFMLWLIASGVITV